VDRFVRWLGGDAEVREVTPTMLARYMTRQAFTHTRAGSPRATVSINRSKSALRAFFAFASEADDLPRNPARHVRLARTHRPPPVVLSKRETRALLRALSRSHDSLAVRDHALFALLLGTGMRLGAAIACNGEDLDLDAGTVTVTTKGGRSERLHLSAALVRRLRPMVAAHPSGPLFRSRSGRRLGPRQTQLRFALWRARAGIARRVTIHSLRHTFATRLYEATRDLRLVQRALGHRHITSTEIYVTVPESALARATRALGLG